MSIKITRIMEGVLVLVCAALLIWVANTIRGEVSAYGLLKHQFRHMKQTVNDIDNRVSRIEITVNTILENQIASTEMIDPDDLRTVVIKPTLEGMVPLWGAGVASEQAVNLILGTIYQESVVGGVTHLRQINGPALGILQIEPATHKDIWDNYLSYRPDKASYVRSLARQSMADFDQELVGNLPYAVSIARLKYWMRSFTWPKDPNDIEALGRIWDEHYNANPEHGFPADFVDSYPK